MINLWSIPASFSSPFPRHNAALDNGTGYAVTHCLPIDFLFSFRQSLVKMRSSTLPWRLAVAGFLSLSLLEPFVRSSPSVNVALETSFSAAPYLVELLYVPRSQPGNAG